MSEAVLSTDIKEYPLLRRGKVRDVYDLDGKLLFVATDRISAYDWVLPNGIPDKGKILNSMSLFWFSFIEDIFPHHLITGDFDSYPEQLKQYDYLNGRSMIVKKANRIDIECVARGYLVGSGFKDYMGILEKQDSEGDIDLYGSKLPPDIKLAGKLPKTIFTPATKEEDGHDMNISYTEMKERVGSEISPKLKEATIAIYEKAAEYALSRRIIIADTKFEFGFIDDELTLIDEILSPDSSRFWPEESYEIGKNPPSFDKQFIRDWLDTTGWDKNSVPPAMPDDIVAKTREKYMQAHKIIVGNDID
ncbi:MAG: phosphoribosylaminoimidazolesuccinocarboxamide synthase [candidate division Zixibacteria bacterium]